MKIKRNVIFLITLLSTFSSFTANSAQYESPRYADCDKRDYKHLSWISGSKVTETPYTLRLTFILNYGGCYKGKVFSRPILDKDPSSRIRVMDTTSKDRLRGVKGFSTLQGTTKTRYFVTIDKDEFFNGNKQEKLKLEQFFKPNPFFKLKFKWLITLRKNSSEKTTVKYLRQ